MTSIIFSYRAIREKLEQPKNKTENEFTVTFPYIYVDADLVIDKGQVVKDRYSEHSPERWHNAYVRGTINEDAAPHFYTLIIVDGLVVRDTRPKKVAIK